jgi:hypothetical protein
MIVFFRHPCEDILFDLKYAKKRMSFRLARKNILFYFKKRIPFFFLMKLQKKLVTMTFKKKKKKNEIN